MAFYFSSETMAFYDTDVFPVASLPTNRVEVTEADYTELMTKQNQGYVIKADNSGNPYAVAQGEATATDIKHAGTIATTLVLGHVKIGDTMQTANDGTLDLKDGAVSEDKLAVQAVGTTKLANQSVTTIKIADANVTTEKLADGAVTEDKLEAVKEVFADETSLTMVEGVNDFTLSVLDGGITATKLAADSVTQTKIKDQQIVRSKLAEESCTSVLSFKDSNNNDLNGTTQRLEYSGAPVLIGMTQLISFKDIVDFTISFDWGDQLDPIAHIGFKIIVWNSYDISHAIDKFERTVSATPIQGNSYAVHCQERFSFQNSSGASDRIKVSIEPLTNINWLKLVNIQLNGIRSPGYNTPSN